MLVSTYEYTRRYNPEEQHRRELWILSAETSGWDRQILHPIMGSFCALCVNDGLCVLFILFVY
jgi:hypothetical protein